MSYRCEKIGKSYKMGHESLAILQDLDFQWGNENVVGIVGESGSGKTTLLSVMAGLLRPDQGKVWIDSTDLYSLSKAELAKFRATKIGIIFQQYHLLPDLNLTENILLPLELNGLAVDKEALDWWLGRLGLSHRRDHYPYQLSGGEQQRVAIARAFIHQPRLIFADEPSGSLDEQTGEEIMELLLQIVREKQAKMFLVTHSSRLAQRCDRVYRVGQGQLHALV